MKIEPFLIPKALHGKAPRTFLSQGEWERIRQFVFRKNGFRCVYCGSKYRLEAHEKYFVNGDNLVLQNVLCVCHKCHEALHPGFALVRNRLPQVVKWFCKVNGVGEAEAMSIMYAAFQKFRKNANVRFLVWDMFAREPWRVFLEEKTILKAESSAKERFNV